MATLVFPTLVDNHPPLNPTHIHLCTDAHSITNSEIPSLNSLPKYFNEARKESSKKTRNILNKASQYPRFIKQNWYSKTNYFYQETSFTQECAGLNPAAAMLKASCNSTCDP